MVKYYHFTSMKHCVKFCGKAQFPHSFARVAQNYGPFPQNFHTRKLGENTVFYAVKAFHAS